MEVEWESEEEREYQDFEPEDEDVELAVQRVDRPAVARQRAAEQTDALWPHLQESVQLGRTTAEAADVEALAASYGVQLRYLRNRGQPMPYINGREGPLLVDIDTLIGPLWHPALLDQLEGRLEGMARRSDWRPDFVDQGGALEIFRARCIDFLTTRFSFLPGFGGGRTATGLNTRITTTASGLRVHYSNTLVIRWVVLGQPTTPLDRPLQSGQFAFAVDGAGQPFAIDSGVFVVPAPHNEIPLTVA